ncbi:MAG: NAD-dependent epimerase/dehydratase family protein [Pseudomonadales bacterium]
MKTLVIGGAGATGQFIVNGLLAKGHDVTLLNRGKHKIAELPESLPHITCDPYDEDALTVALHDQSFDLCIATYGRLRAVARVMKNKCDRFISAGGAPAYRGYMNAALWQPEGLPAPTDENATLISRPEEDEKGYRIVQTEQALFELIPSATHFRYPYVYGPYQMVPREWCIVRRIRDRRSSIIIPDGGLTLQTYGFAENIAHAVLLAVEQAEQAAGQIFNCGDAVCMSLNQVVEIIASALDHRLETISIPNELCSVGLPMLGQPQSTHRLLDMGKLKHRLGYTDLVEPAEALGRTARWLLENQPESGGMEEMVLQDPFDYEAEDQIVSAWKSLARQIPDDSIFTVPPGVGMAYSGPGGRARSSSQFDA